MRPRPGALARTWWSTRSTLQVACWRRPTAASTSPTILEEIGKPLKEVSDGLGLRIIRDGTPYGFWRPQVEKLEADDVIMEILPTVD
jgi:hypothetical protein